MFSLRIFGILGNLLSAFALTLTFICAPAALADDKKEEKSPAIEGPSKVLMDKDLAEIDLPAGYGYLPKEYAQEIVKKDGSSAEGVVGIVFPVPSKTQRVPDFLMYCTFHDMGYVKDDDAGQINADELLKTMKEGTKEENEQRKAEGVPPFFVGNWVEKPHYVKDKHQVIWALEVKDEDTETAPVSCINYNTRILGRRGVLSMNLVATPDKIEDSKAKSKILLDNTAFVPGSRYSDFKPGDKDSGMGITGLILGGGALAAAAKFGVFGGIYKFLLPIILVGKKFIIVIIAAIGAAVAKIFKKGGSDNNGGESTVAGGTTYGAGPENNDEGPKAG